MRFPASLTAWQWCVGLLLLLATMINYMDRQVLAILSVRITDQLQMTESQYGNVEWAFGTAFAIGSLFFGFLADRISVKWLYPSVLLAWSAVGFATGYVSNYPSLLACRSLLGFFEAGHWPCALVVTQAILTSQDRAFGNSILQSGASVGAILTPLVIAAVLWWAPYEEAWRLPFQAIGMLGLFWCFVWCVAIPSDAIQRKENASRGTSGLAALVFNPKFVALALVLMSINTPWQLIRAWLPKFLQRGRGYSEAEAMLFNSVYYVATDIGCLAAGFMATVLARGGWHVHRARLWTYAVCAMLASLTCLAAALPQGWLLLAVLLLVGGGTLGLFPCYYSFNQELSTSDLGKAVGLLSFIGWMTSSPIHRVFGAQVDRTGSYDISIALVGLAPFIGLIALILLWPRESSKY